MSAGLAGYAAPAVSSDARQGAQEPSFRCQSQPRIGVSAGIRECFPGSHDLLVQQNEELNRLQLPRILDEGELIRYEVSQVLVPVNETDALKIAADLPESRRYCRPWTRDFLQDFSQAYYNQFHSPLQVNSLVRTVEQQQRLRRHNRYAAPEWGDTASTHLTGVTFDLSRRGLTGEQYGWILAYLLPLKASGMVDPIEESQPVLHVVVFEKYSERFDQKNKLVRGERTYRGEHVDRRECQPALAEPVG